VLTALADEQVGRGDQYAVQHRPALSPARLGRGRCAGTAVPALVQNWPQCGCRRAPRPSTTYPRLDLTGASRGRVPGCWNAPARCGQDPADYLSDGAATVAVDRPGGRCVLGQAAATTRPVAST
jgi:hypothetical protein